MIQVRDIFQLHFGKAREAIALLKESTAAREGVGFAPVRVLTDLTGEYYTLVLESTYESLAELESHLQQAGTDQTWRDWYGRFTPLVRSGRREIYRIVDVPEGKPQERANR